MKKKIEQKRNKRGSLSKSLKREPSPENQIKKMDNQPDKENKK